MLMRTARRERVCRNTPTCDPVLEQVQRGGILVRAAQAHAERVRRLGDHPPLADDVLHLLGLLHRCLVDHLRAAGRSNFSTHTHDQPRVVSATSCEKACSLYFTQKLGAIAWRCVQLFQSSVFVLLVTAAQSLCIHSPQ